MVIYFEASWWKTLSMEEKKQIMSFKYDILERLRKNLYEVYGENTAKTYYHAVKNALEDQRFKSVNEIDVDKVLEYCREVKVKCRVSAVKHGLLRLKAIEPSFKVDKYAFDDITRNKRNIRVGKFETFKLDTALRRINKISDMKLKLAYRLMLVSGLRVAEVANLKKSDIKIDNGKLVVTVLNGKGNKDRTVEALNDEYLIEKLSKMLDGLRNEQRIFYKDDHMIKTACKNKFKCHDLRRASAQIVYNSINDRNEAIEKVQKHLGHSENNTVYKKYLARSIDFSGTKWVKGGARIE